MTLPLFLLEVGHWPDENIDNPGPDSLTVTGAEARHALASMRLTVGQECYIGDGAGRRARVVIEQVEPSQFVARVLDIEFVPTPALRLVLVQALAKGDRDEAAIEAATELGADEIVPWQAERSIVQWRGERAVKSHQKWVNLVTAAAKQSRRHHTPLVTPLVTTDQLARRVSQAACALVLHEEGNVPFGDLVLPGHGDVVVIVGPEGGISPAELRQLAGAGGQVIRLGAQVLRASTAGPAALAALSATCRWT